MKSLGVVKTNRIIVVGSANEDYLVRVPRTARPGETVVATSLAKQPGGKGANQSVAAARLGADVHFVGAVGRDDDGASILRSLQLEGVSIDSVRIIDHQPTGLALITVEEEGENSITVVSGANSTVTADRALEAVNRLASAAAIVVVQAELGVDVIDVTSRAVVERGARFVLNLAPFRSVSSGALAAADPLVLNETEAEQLLGSSPDGVEGWLASLDVLRGHARSVVVTLGEDGAVWAGPEGRGHREAAAAVDVVDTTGAGDAFVGGLAFALASGADLEEAVRVGVLCGSFAIRGVGAQRSYARPADIGLGVV